MREGWLLGTAAAGDPGRNSGSNGCQKGAMKQNGPETDPGAENPPDAAGPQGGQRR